MAAARTTRRIWMSLCALLLTGATDAAAAPQPAPPPGPAAVAAPAPQPDAGRWRVDAGVSFSTPHALRENGHDTPAPQIETKTSAPWKPEWRERTAWVSLSRDLLDDERRSLGLGVRVGATRGRFSAANSELRFSEAWSVSPALSWGATATGELRRQRRAGPFLRARLDYSRAGAGEDTETLESPRPETRESDRDARFAWHRTDLAVSLGWRRRSLAAFAGVGYARFVLLKRLRYHIPVPEAPDANPFASELARKLNERESTYNYRNTGPWSPLAGLEWRFADGWLLAADCTLADAPQCRVAVGLDF